VAEGSEQRRIGLGSASALVVANMIGAGVFTTSGFALGDLGRTDAVMWAWAVGGVVALCGALSYGALARRIPESGGEYTFLAETLHPLAGIAAGWVSLLAGFTAPIAAAALALQAYVASPFGETAHPAWFGSCVIAAAGLLHGLRLHVGVAAQNLAVAAKLIAIALLVGFAAFSLPDLAKPDPASLPAVEPTAFAVSLMWIFFSYSGWNAAVYIAGEVRDPDRNLPRSLLLATVTVTALYLALNWVFLHSAPAEALAGKAEVAAIAAEALGGQPLRAAVTALVALALLTSISSMVMAGPRVYAQMARDGVVPRLFAGGDEVPSAAVALQVALAIGVLWVSTLAELLGAIGFALGISASATVVGLMVLRTREGADRVPVPGYPWIPGLFVTVNLGAALLMASRDPLRAIVAFGVLAAGVSLYRVFGSPALRRTR
jgi:APA family basic amino acid/polyamine antiporter